MQAENEILVHGIKVRLIPPDILRAEVPKDMHVSLEVLRALWENGNKTLPGIKRKVLVVFNSAFVPAKEASDFMVSNERAAPLAAEAFVINSAALSLIANFYFTIKKPKIPSKAFDDETIALAWLRGVEPG